MERLPVAHDVAQLLGGKCDKSAGSRGLQRRWRLNNPDECLLQADTPHIFFLVPPGSRLPRCGPTTMMEIRRQYSASSMWWVVTKMVVPIAR